MTVVDEPSYHQQSPFLGNANVVASCTEPIPKISQPVLGQKVAVEDAAILSIIRPRQLPQEVEFMGLHRACRKKPASCESARDDFERGPGRTPTTGILDP